MRTPRTLALSACSVFAMLGCSTAPEHGARKGGTQEQVNLIMNNPHIPPDQKAMIRADIEQQKQRPYPKKPN